jgi:CTP synthase
VISNSDVGVIYELPIALHEEGLDTQLVELLNIWSRQPDLTQWHRTGEKIRKPANGTVSIAIAGKYVHLQDSYKSLHEALVHGGLHNDVKVDLTYIDSEKVTPDNVQGTFDKHDAILVPGGFGDRGSEGKVEAIRHARENRIPFFGICLGMQMAVVEYARNVCNLESANSVEFDPESPNPVVDLMPDQRGVKEKGATMRLGAYPCVLEVGSLAEKIYGSREISERHRHRYEVNNDFRERLEAGGLKLSGLSPDRRLVEMVELGEHPHFVGCQFHPEFKSRPHEPHPLFSRFVKAALTRRDLRANEPEEASDQADRNMVH